MHEAQFDRGRGSGVCARDVICIFQTPKLTSPQIDARAASLWFSTKQQQQQQQQSFTHTPKLNVLSLWNICKRHCSDHRQNASADNGSRTTGNGTHIHTQSHTPSSRLELVDFCHKSDSTENNNEVEVERKDEGADGRENMI